MKFAVIGAGAIGRLFAGLLAKAQQEVVLITRREEAALEIRRRGIRMSDNRRAESVRVKTTTEVNTLRGSEIVLLAVKSYDTTSVAEWVHPHLRPGGLLLTLQNGLGNIEAISAEMPEYQLAGGITTMGARLLEDARVIWTGYGETVIGEPERWPSPRTENLAKILSEAGIPTSTTSNLKRTLWGKALINAGINPVTALLKITNGELMVSKEGWLTASEAVQEGLLVANAEQVRFQTDMIMEMRKVAESTANNRSSMLVDVENHRKTEIDAINGAIVRLGRKHGIPTPINETLWTSIKSLEESNEHKSPSKIPAEA